MRGPTRPRHPFVTALLAMTTQVVFPELQRREETVKIPRTDNDERLAAAATKRERKNRQRAAR